MNHKFKGMFKWLDTFYGKDVWIELGDNFNASMAECKVAFKEWFGNKFNVNITMVNYWLTN
jgi:hypothetical protein